MASPAMMDIREAEFSDENSPIETEERVNDRKYNKNEKYGKEKEPECPDETSPVDMEEGVSDRKYDKNENTMRKKRQNSQMTILLLICRKVKVIKKMTRI